MQASSESFCVDHIPDEMFDISGYDDENAYEYLDLDRSQRRTFSASRASTSVRSDDTSSSYSSIHSPRKNGLNRLLRRDYPIPRNTRRSYDDMILNFNSKQETEDDEAVYQNINSFNGSEDTSHLYARLLCSVLLQVLDSFDGSRRLAKIEKGIEKIVGIETEKRLDLLNYDEKKEHIYFFCKQVEICLRRINRSSLANYRRVSDELCAILSSARKPQQSKLQKLTNSFKKVFYSS